MKKIYFIIAFCFFAVSNISAQQTDKNDMVIKNTECSFSTHFGYSYMSSGIAGLSNMSKDYSDKLRSGFAWDLQFDFRVSRFTAGILYSLYLSKGTTDYTSDKISINYIAPQLGLYLLKPQQSKISVKMFFGAGYIIYENNSRVFGNKRKVSKKYLGSNLGLGGIYRFSSHLGFSLDARLIEAETEVFNVEYHGNSFDVEQKLPLNQLSISFGINYIF
ncbi:MAG: porin family protein [Prevotellaceae bacterium]|jgi:hypothetical protein|nr:porin family protein [Prevotellaceae bacterium]